MDMDLASRRQIWYNEADHVLELQIWRESCKFGLRAKSLASGTHLASGIQIWPQEHRSGLKDMD